MNDMLLRAHMSRERLDVSVFLSTTVVHSAQVSHGIRGTSLLSLGRLLTATGLVGLNSKRPGVTSIQILSQSRIQQIFADVTDHGWLRGYVTNTSLELPLILSEDLTGRRTIGPVVRPGQVSVIRLGERGEYVQSTAPIFDGEVDSDVEHFLNQSDQIPSVLACECLVDLKGKVVAAGGILARSLPDGSIDALNQIKDRIKEGLLLSALQKGTSAENLLQILAPGAKESDPRVVPIWRCRCSHQKVLSTLALLDVMELADMAAADHPTEIKCELCSTLHIATQADISNILKQKTKANA